jgi:asparagine synthase (glutamine-hydrolysing)
MCGIFGLYSPAGLRGDREALIQGLRVAGHRGPDGEGFSWFDTRRNAGRVVLGKDNVSAATLLLGHRRLAIIDLSDAGLQPMSSEDGQVWITFNGEIYNFVELREELEAAGVVFRSHSDTEVIVRAYEAWGPDAFARFVGMWAFAILDLRRRRLLLSRDRFGIKPLHYVAEGPLLAFGSEIKQLLAVPGVSKAVNPRAVYDYLQYEVADIGTETFFAGVLKVRPGHTVVMDLDSGDRAETAYYTPPTGPVLTDITPSEAAARFRDLLEDSVRIHLRADVPVGTCLSGGLDSGALSLLIRQVAQRGGLPVERHAFSCHFDIPEADEREFTLQNMAAAEVIPHFIEPTADDIAADLKRLVWHQDEPFGSTSIFAQWAVFRLVRETGIKVVLDGQGADEMLGGYASTAPHFFLELAARGHPLQALSESWQWARLQGRPWHTVVPSSRLRRLASAFAGKGGGVAPAPVLGGWMRADFERAVGPSSLVRARAQGTPFGSKAHFANLLHRFFFDSNLPGLLRYEDRNSMAFSVESRVPFLDHRLVDFAFGLPSEIKFRGGYAKRVLRDAMDGLMPEPVRMRARKMGFATPEMHWQSGVLRPLIHEAVASGSLSDFIDREAAARTLAAIEGNGRLDFLPWRWLNVHLWRQEFGV